MKLPTEGVHLPGLLHMSQVPPASYMLDERELKCSDPNPNPNPNPSPNPSPNPNPNPNSSPSPNPSPNPNPNPNPLPGGPRGGSQL